MALTTREHNQRHRAKRIDLIKARKDQPCIECGLEFPSIAMDLHHPEGVAKMTGGSSFNRWSMSVGLDTLRAELAKCEVICANCHRIHHWPEKTKP